MSPLALQIILAALTEAPQLAALLRDELTALKGDLTPEQGAAIDAACDAAHAALQAAEPRA